MVNVRALIFLNMRKKSGKEKEKKSQHMYNEGWTEYVLGSGEWKNLPVTQQKETR